MRIRAKGLTALLLGSLLAVGATAAPQAGAGTTPAATTASTRGLEIGIPAYSFPDYPMLLNVQATTPAPSVVILNPGSGEAPFAADWQARADALRAKTTPTGEHTKVIGYVHTEATGRDRDAVLKDVRNYLVTPDGKLHVDGIFFDTSSRNCGVNNVERDFYLDLRHQVQALVHSIDPTVQELVVNNPGTAVQDCFLEPGKRTADTFVTFEGTYDNYINNYLGGNVFNLTAGYYPGAGFDPDGTSYWHLIHATPNATAMKTALSTAFTRGAGYAYATDDVEPNPWDATPAWGFGAETSYAATIG
ncbi:spherulation-specific family 4 protein [Kitasatospora sp. NPDC051984]|uniref:spherulation-specific family 4 protein n=1 Tax=Kitasatospora sp. NPDC051984 TaxID=3364059 RepID=UPI0037C5BFD0